MKKEKTIEELEKVIVGGSELDFDEFKRLVDLDDVYYEENKLTIFKYAAYRQQKIDMVKYLVEEKKLDINEKDGWGYTPLHYAVESNNENLVKYLLKHGADINALLHWAAANNVEKLVKYLVEHGADINKEDVRGKTPLYLAVEYNNKNLMKYLVEHGADINKEDEDWWTPLMSAINSGNENIVKYLVENKADINKQNKSGITPLYWAVYINNESIVKYLVEHGADVNKEDVRGYTPLHRAAGSNNENLVKYLVEHRADVNKKNILGKTPIMLAKSDRIRRYLDKQNIENEVNEEISEDVIFKNSNKRSYEEAHEKVEKRRCLTNIPKEDIRTRNKVSRRRRFTI